MNFNRNLQVKAFQILSSLGKELKYHRSEVKILQVVAEKVYELTQAPHIYGVFKHRLDSSLDLVLNYEDGHIKSVGDAEVRLQEIGINKILEVIKTHKILSFKTTENLRRREVSDRDSSCWLGASWLGVPMSAIDRTIGALIVQHPTQENAYTEELAQILDTITDLAANAIDYYRLHERVKIIAELEEKFTIIEAKSEREILEKIYEQIQSLRDIDTQSLSIVLQDKYKKTLKVVLLNGKLCDTHDKHKQECLLKRLNQDRINVIIKNQSPLLLCREKEIETQIDEVYETELASWVGVPMRIHGRAIGVFIIEHPDVDSPEYLYNKNDAEFLDILSDRAANAIHRVQLEQRYTALAKIESDLLAQTDLNEETIIKIIAERAREVSDVYNLCIFLLDELTEELTLKFAYRKDKSVDVSDDLQKNQILANVPERIIKKVLKTQQRKRIDTKAEVKSYFIPEPQHKYPASLLAVPMKIRDTSIGVFVVYHMKEEYIYDSDDARFLDELSDYAALALDNVHLRRLEKQNFEQRISNLYSVHEIYKAVNENSLEDILDLILEAGVQFTDSDYADLWLYDKRHQSLQIKANYKNRRTSKLKNLEQSTDENWNAMGGIAGQALINRQSYYSPNVKEDPHYVEVSPDVRSEFIIPLIFQDKILGILNLESKKRNAFSDDCQKLTETLADSAAVAIGTSGLKSQLELSNRKLKKNNNRLTLYKELLEKLITTIDVPADELSILEYIHDRASFLMDTGNMYIALYEPENDLIDFKIVYVRNESVPPYPPRKLSEGRGKTEQIIKTKKAIRHTSKESQKWYKYEGQNYIDEDKNFPAFAWLGVPILLGEQENDRCLGVIATYSTDEQHIYTQDNQDILEQLARWAAIALENARITQKVAEQENMLTRSLVAQDLVHRLNSLAGSIPIWLQLLEKEVKTTQTINVDNVDRYISKIQGNLRGLFDRVQKLKQPEQEIEVELNKVLSSLLDSCFILYSHEVESDRLTIQHNLDECVCRVKGLPSLIENSLNSIIKNGIEAILEKDVGQLKVEVSDFDEKFVRIIVSDTGIGIPKNLQEEIFTPFFTTKKNGSGYGLWRAKSIFEKMGGQISFESDPGVGTSFIITLPKF
ncbi:GAF domain-containing protein [Geitlerinema sp. CS-897]|nr:GAF domain-containing protein [Geitlerinema sp. CS-897]